MGGQKKRQKLVNVVCERPLTFKKIYVKHCSKDVRLPVQLQRAMAAEAEAAREARAKVSHLFPNA